MKYFPEASSNPTNLIFELAAPVWKDPGAVVNAAKQLQSTRLFNTLPGPLDPAGTSIAPAIYVACTPCSAIPKLLATLPAAGSAGAKVPLALTTCTGRRLVLSAPTGARSSSRRPQGRRRQLDTGAERRPAIRRPSPRPAQNRGQSRAGWPVRRRRSMT